MGRVRKDATDGIPDDSAGGILPGFTIRVVHSIPELGQLVRYWQEIDENRRTIGTLLKKLGEREQTIMALKAQLGELETALEAAEESAKRIAEAESIEDREAAATTEGFRRQVSDLMAQRDELQRKLDAGEASDADTAKLNSLIARIKALPTLINPAPTAEEPTDPETPGDGEDGSGEGSDTGTETEDEESEV